MESKSIAGRVVNIVSGETEILGHYVNDTHAVAYTLVQFQDGTKVRSVLCDSTLSPLLEQARGRFVFLPWRNRNILVAVDLPGRGLRVVDEPTFKHLGGNYMAQAFGYLVAGILSAFFLIGIPILIYAACLFIKGMSLSSVAKYAEQLREVGLDSPDREAPSAHVEQAA